MAVRANKPAFNIREKLKELTSKFGLKGTELARAETAQDARDLVSAGRKNKIINGAMLIDQRHNGASNTDSNGYHTDRFRTQVGGMDELVQTYQQISDGPPGFPKSLKITTTGPETTIVDNEFVSVYQKIEGQNLQDFAYGTSSAKSVTVSFYVKSSIIGTFGYTVYRNESTDRAINKTYTINNANTWERKTITLEGDTAQAIGNDNADNWWNCWHLASSPYYKSDPAPRWATYDGNNWAGYHEQNGVVTTNGATWQITGVQIEIGKNATEFEHRSYGEELALCQRYYVEDSTGGADTPLMYFFQYSNAYRMLQIPFPVPMRTSTPTVVITMGSGSGTTGLTQNYTRTTMQYKAFVNLSLTSSAAYIVSYTASAEL
jgi:hypothetical protein